MLNIALCFVATFFTSLSLKHLTDNIHSFVSNLSSRYNVPFQAATHHAVSPYRCVLVPSSDLQTLNPARQALQVAWNTAWHSGIDNLLQELCGIARDVSE